MGVVRKGPLCRFNMRPEFIWIEEKTDNVGNQAGIKTILKDIGDILLTSTLGRANLKEVACQTCRRMMQ